MALGKITKTAVEALPPGGKWLWDADHREAVKGFGARRQVDGVFYYLRYRLHGRQHLKAIGRHGSPCTPDTARNQAKRGLGEVAAGKHPFEPEGGVRSAETFRTEADRYLSAKQAALKPRAYVEVKRHLHVHAKPLHRSRLSDITRREIATRLAEIEMASGPVARNRFRASLSAFFNWTITEGFIDANPVTGTAKADEGRGRERVLSPAELAEIWATLPQDHFGDIVRLLTLTGQRREEIGALRWKEVDLVKDWITFPPERVKNNREHRLPLSPEAKAIIDRQRRRNDRDLIFGIGAGGFSGWSDCKARLDAAILAKRRKRDPKAKPMPPWRLHDLRRTAATGMAELGVLPHIVEAVLNHVSGHKSGVAGIYNHARYDDEMRVALERWAGHVQSVCGSKPKQVAA